MKKVYYIAYSDSPETQIQQITFLKKQNMNVESIGVLYLSQVKLYSNFANNDESFYKAIKEEFFTEIHSIPETVWYPNMLNGWYGGIWSFLDKTEYETIILVIFQKMFENFHLGSQFFSGQIDSFSSLTPCSVFQEDTIIPSKQLLFKVPHPMTKKKYNKFIREL